MTVLARNGLRLTGVVIKENDREILGDIIVLLLLALMK